MSVHIVPSAARLPTFRVEQLLRRLRQSAPEISGLVVQNFFLVQGIAEPQALKRLLGEGPERLPNGEGRIFVVPRIGTMSPWSSKATDIARTCGLSGVERIERGRVLVPVGASRIPEQAYADLHDPMMESVLTDSAALKSLFDAQSARPLRRVPILTEGKLALSRANIEWGLALSDEEIDYLVRHAIDSGVDPSDAELMMFAQVNSEHCRHKIFNAEFRVDGMTMPQSLFDMIRDSHRASPEGVLSAYKDNAAVIEGHGGARWMIGADRRWVRQNEPIDILMKVETHNHPTGISPNPGAATGAGGEIRDEAATGRGGKPKAGLCGFSVSNLRIPDFEQTWEPELGRPKGMASALSIMLEAPIGAAAYNNEFGRPNLAGYFRTLETITPDGRNRGYHKPIMIAGGYGNIRRQHVEKCEVIEDLRLIVLGGPAMLIGLGGGAASSMATGTSSQALDFASVQRANPELERRCQEVIDACWSLGENNPILSIHDVGAGGISNALPEMVDSDGRGGHFRLREVRSADSALSPMEIWCNESQERYVLVAHQNQVEQIESICARERCPMAVVGSSTAERQLVVEDELDGSRPVDMPMEVLLGKPPRMLRDTHRQSSVTTALEMPDDLLEATRRVLRHPSVASKQFLITIGDRTVGGLTVRDQMVGPWQVPVADCAVTASGFESTTGEAMGMGERSPLALINAPASGRMAVGEAITNIAAARIASLSDLRLSANWMAACGQADEDARLYDTVRAVGSELCPKLGIAIPVGKDSLSMKSVWQERNQDQVQTAPLSLIVSAFAPVADVRKSLTPQIRSDVGETYLVLIDLGNGRNRLGGSILAQVHGLLGESVPDLDDPVQLKKAFDLVQHWNERSRILAYHDRSDGGLVAALLEMAFAGHCGLDIEIESCEALFSEELGMVLQVSADDLPMLEREATAQGLTIKRLGTPRADDRILVRRQGQTLIDQSRNAMFRCWAETSYRMARLRDNPDCADEEFESAGRSNDPGLSALPTFSPEPKPSAKYLGTRPRMAILREQGVNGQAEMAWAFDTAGFDTIDVHMTDVIAGYTDLSDFHGLVACGGFSYGDVLGAGQGWAKTIMFNPRALDAFTAFFADQNKFALGVCNGCQMMAALRSIIPGAADWPQFRQNRSEQFEARWSMVELLPSRSVFFADMEGSRLPIAIAHGEGRAEFQSPATQNRLLQQQQIPMRYIDNSGEAAKHYPFNPNGSPGGITSVCNADGRISILMPHPERTVHGVTGSWWPESFDRTTPWFRMFENARAWLG